MQLDGKVAFITGGSSGIGAASARHLASMGARVALVSRTEDDVQMIAQDITTSGGKAIAISADVSQPDDVQDAISQTVDRWGRLDFVVANAGINGVWAPLEDLTPDDWDKTLDINLKGTFLTVKYAVPHLKKQGGAVVITSSVNGTRKFSNTGATAYACSKAGQVAFAKMTALELAKHHIRVNVICPGAIETEIDESTTKRNLEAEREPVEFPEGNIPLTDGKPGSAHQVAELIVFLLSDASSHITGTEVWIDGGETLLQG